MPRPASPPPNPPEDRPVDLGRLRIERRPGTAVRVRGFPWIRVLMLVMALGTAFLFRDSLRALFENAGGIEVRAARAVKQGPGSGTEAEVAANGYVVADRSASLATVLSGRLVELNAKEGDTVYEGDVVARIQYDDYAAQRDREAKVLAAALVRVTAARRALAVAAAEIPRLERGVSTQKHLVLQALEDLARLDRDVKRNAGLREQKRIDQGTWDRIQSAARIAAIAVRVSEGRLKESEAALPPARERLAQLEAQIQVVLADTQTAAEGVRIAQIQLDKTKIIAPFTGIVIRKDAESGEIIAPTGAGNAPGSVLTIVDPKSFEIQVELSERRILQVSPGDRATVVLEADPDTGYPAKVRKVWPRAERSKGTIEVRVTLDKRPAILRPDMAVRVLFAGKQAPSGGAEAQKAVVTIPRNTVLTSGARTFVFVINGETVERRSVELGAARAADVVVQAGLAGGELLVVEPSADLADGARVRVKGNGETR